MAYSDSFPAIRPSFQFNADAGRLDPRISYSRSTTGTYFGTEKVLSSENLLTHSENFNSASWNTVGATLSGSVTAPNGTNTAWEITPDSSASAHMFAQSVAISTNEQYTAVAHIKAGAATHGWVALRSEYLTYCYAQLEFSTSTLTTGGAGWTGITGTSTALGNGWFRITVTGTSPSSATSPFFRIGINDGTAFDGSGYPLWTSTSTETMYAWGAQLNTTGATVYDSPTTTQIAREYQTKLQTAAINAPRFEFSATDSASMGLLIEGSSTNLYPYGSDQSNWSGARRLFQSNAAISPAGTLTADLVTLNDDDANTHYVFQYVSVTSGTTYTISQYVKAAGLNYVTLRPNTGFASNLVTFDLSNGTIVSNAGGLGASIEPVGNEWYRISVTATANATVSNATCALYFSESSGTTVTATGDSYRGVLLWGAQWEASSFASSLVDTGTSSSTATRAADSAAMVSSSLFDSGEHTLYFEGDVLSSETDDPRLLNLSDGTGNERIRLDNNNGVFLRLETATGNVSSASIQDTIDLTVGSHKIVGTLKNGEARLVRNGATVIESTTGTEVVPTGLTTLDIGKSHGTSNYLDCHVRRISYWNTALTETQAQAVSS